MGLTYTSTGKRAKANETDLNTGGNRIIAIAGNPNVGKSTIFNALTGLNQHTGNWPGKTVSNAIGCCKTENATYTIVDIPGTYSLLAHSPEEEIARNFICFERPYKTVIVCDATSLERNLNLVLQILEITRDAVVCVNLLDEAERKGIKIDLKKLSLLLGVPVLGAVARNPKSLAPLIKALGQENLSKTPYFNPYPEEIEAAISILEPILKEKLNGVINPRWLSLKLLNEDEALTSELEKHYGNEILYSDEITEAKRKAFEHLSLNGIDPNRLKDMIVASLFWGAETISRAVINKKGDAGSSLRKADKILTSKTLGFPIMLLGLGIILWITIIGANFISDYLSSFLNFFEGMLSKLSVYLNCPDIIHRFLIEGVYRVPAWVVSVMLPPMAIFFPLFTLLEDLGYLPRVAFNLDKPFKKCGGCGKQALSMCMGLGCNAAGVVGCRIIDSKRERLLAVLTNSFIPCNGRFPTVIALISLFLVPFSGIFGNILSALILTAFILLSIAVTFFATKLLSLTLLKGENSSYTLEMPPFRPPQIGKIIIRSVLDRTIFVLGRAISVAVPAGIIIWLLANIQIANISLLSYFTKLLSPIGRLIGLDGIILTAFILGLPANEIVMPIALMAYLSEGALSQLTSTGVVGEILVAHGWTALTAINTIIFCLFHFPCSTTLVTIKKETGSLKWTMISALLPTAIGVILCLLNKLIFLVL